jgi:hypothetical protein
MNGRTISTRPTICKQILEFGHLSLRLYLEKHSLLKAAPFSLHFSAGQLRGAVCRNAEAAAVFAIE